MSFLKKLFTPAKPEKRYYTFNVNCIRCGEIIEGRIDLDNDVSLNDSGTAYFARKVLMGSGENHCFQQIEVEMTFTTSRDVVEQNIKGGTFAK
ncbi:MAG TPA: hypothetical protein VLA72_21635 [Anaerolineales bacterium]|nr:hypothetical protein [Anaerolineales bacterium]